MICIVLIAGLWQLASVSRCLLFYFKQNDRQIRVRRVSSLQRVQSKIRDGEMFKQLRGTKEFIYPPFFPLQGCGAVIVTETGGVLATPDYPSLAHRFNCNWTVIGSTPGQFHPPQFTTMLFTQRVSSVTGDRVTLTMTHLQNTNPQSSDCPSSHGVVTRDGRTNLSPGRSY